MNSALQPTRGQIAAAKVAQAAERHRVFVQTGVVIDDQGDIEQERRTADLGLKLANFASAAIYGPRGQYR